MIGGESKFGKIVLFKFDFRPVVDLRSVIENLIELFPHKRDRMFVPKRRRRTRWKRKVKRHRVRS